MKKRMNYLQIVPPSGGDPYQIREKLHELNVKENEVAFKKKLK